MNMKSNPSNSELLSSMLDGEISDAELDMLLARLDQSDPSLRPNWHLYHQIGDALRSDELAIPMSADFSSKFAQRLAQEPIVFAPAAFRQEQPAAPLQNQTLVANGVASSTKTMIVSPRSISLQGRNAWRIVASLGGLAAAVALGVSIAPQLSGVLNGQGNGTGVPPSLAQISNQAPITAQAPAQAPVNAGIQLVNNQDAPNRPVEREDEAQDAATLQIIRDPGLDSYLQAHQKFSPSIGSTARYVRQANTATLAPAEAK